MSFPKVIQKHLRNKHFILSEVGMTDSNVYVYDDFILKVEDTYHESNREYEVMKWLENRVVVPKIIEFIRENNKNYLLMTKIEGKMACDKSLLEDIDKLIKLLAKALKELWKIDIKNCGFDQSIPVKLEHIEYNLKNNLVDEQDFDYDILKLYNLNNKHEVYQWLKENRPTEELIFTHGDFCFPNLLFKNNKLSGFIDLGRAGLSDKWNDLSLCIRSLRYNLGDRYKDKYMFDLLDILNVKYDQHKFHYYLLLDELF